MVGMGRSFVRQGNHRAVFAARQIRPHSFEHRDICLGDPRDIGHGALFFAADEASYITDQTQVIDSGVTLIE